MNVLKQTLSDLYWKTFVWLDYSIRFKEIPKNIELTDIKNQVKINGILYGFYPGTGHHYEILQELSEYEIQYYIENGMCD